MVEISHVIKIHVILVKKEIKIIITKFFKFKNLDEKDHHEHEISINKLHFNASFYKF